MEHSADISTFYCPPPHVIKGITLTQTSQVSKVDNSLGGSLSFGPRVSSKSISVVSLPPPCHALPCLWTVVIVMWVGGGVCVGYVGISFHFFTVRPDPRICSRSVPRGTLAPKCGIDFTGGLELFWRADYFLKKSWDVLSRLPIRRVASARLRRPSTLRLLLLRLR